MKIEVWSDFVCPFCYIGKRRLESALENFPNKDAVDIEYKSYELDPNADKNPGKTVHELLANKYGMTVEKAKNMNDNMKKQAAEVGLTYNFETMQHTNTFDAHRLAHYANKQGKGKEMTERLLHAYFTESKLISDLDTLVDLAGEVGLNKEEVLSVLKTDQYRSRVREDEDTAKQIGVQGVPFFVFNEKYAVSGAQPVEVFSEVLEKVWEEEQEKPTLQSLNPKTSKTTYCTDDGCMEEE
ncbi:Predicted dithiol-disulfide isomerase, DsbA family [Oceanobacillus limi]|uniref:Predicted dithiol-disulfide isomerase, DsbA family n=1 Tax=Oceanobacillus limi TaxID=930131 RepID=A0A1I0AXQ6_9BACI|nr:DsbA family oxidoreductase [Oceanobacillus limi]SES98798.1 Predicted dithiol-disulfide isomerase, DsbA family [Oceanobacillus limi]